MKKYFFLLIPFVSVLLCSLVAFTQLDNKIADLFQRTLSPLSETENVLMVNVDDSSVANIGTWPFSREVYADALITLKDLGAEAAVFDLSFLDKSQPRLDKDYVVNKLPRYVDGQFAEMTDGMMYIFGCFADKTFTAADAEDAAGMYLQLSENAENQIKTNISYTIKDVDAILADNLKFFNNSYLTLTFNDEYEVTDSQKAYLEKYIALDNIKVAKNAKVPSFDGVQPAIPDFLERAKKAGFVNAEADDDGYLRRLFLVMECDGKYYGQLLFTPILEHFGNPEIEVTKTYILLKDCKIDNETVKDIKIPLDQDGSVIVKYPHKSYYDYNSLSFWSIYRLAALEKDFEEFLVQLMNSGFFMYCEDETPIDCYSNASYIHDELCNGESEDYTYEMYAYYKNEFYSKTKDYLYGDTENLLKADYEGDISTQTYISQCFTAARQKYENLVSSREKVQEKVQNSFCIFGTTATSTTDFGLIQYEEKYPNPGVHYTIANQILTQDFVGDSPVWISIIISIVLSFGYGLLARRIKSTGKQMILGGGLLVLSIALLLLIFVLSKTYIGTAIPVLSLAVCFVAQTVMSLILTSKDKKFITGAFSQCLSPDVVKELVEHPESFKLGGGSYEMSAIFTDIQKFSGFSELLSAEQLVALLNYYLTKMSDIIMEEKGTVDKYEGDAIVALVGAPLKMKDHAARACSAAIKMKKAEVEMNKEILQIASSDSMPQILSDEESNNALYEAFKIMVKNKRTIFTRIGINSGSIVAGYMGSDKKKNYTMMGNNVNLASRLEGVNKQYRTGGILVSAATRMDLGDEFVVRSLDRVQVVNVKTPIRLYEVIDFKSDVDETTIKYVSDWEDFLALFEKGDYTAALEGFKKLSAQRPTDNVAKYYIELIEKFFILGKYPTEQDDFGVAYNFENPEDMEPLWIGSKYEIKGTFKLLQK